MNGIAGREHFEHSIKEWERQLKESEERYRRLVEVSPDLIAVHSEWRIVYINSSGAKMLGATNPNELVGRPILGFIDPAYRKAAKDHFLRVQKGKATGPWEEKYIRLNGEEIDVEVMAVPIIYREKPAVQVVARDITERKKNEVRLREAKELSDALNRINAAINSTLDFDVIMKRVVTESAKALDSETAGIALREEGYWVTRYVYGLPQNLVGRKLSEDRAAITGLAAKTKAPIAVDDAFTDNRVNVEIMEKHGIRSFMVVPLMARGEVIGALSFNYYAHQVTFTEAQIDFLRKLAASISLALENARLYSSERDIADTLQDALLSVPEKIDHLEYGVLYRSATEAAQVGGDFYDLFELEHNRVVFTVGDIAGKGLEAASLTAMVKNTMRAYALEGYDPAQVMAKTNEAIKAISGPSSFVTVIFAIFDKETRKLLYCNAGHPAAIIKREAQTVELLEVYSPIIGAFAGLPYKNGETVLSIGDTMILYTDGVIEARHDREFFEEERLVKFIRGLKPISAKEVPKRIFDEVLRFSGGRLSDDVAILALAYTGK